MNYLEEWTKNVVARGMMPLRKCVQAQGVHDKHTGPSWQFAKVELRAEPAEAFGVVFDLPGETVEMLQEHGWLDEIVFGALDVLATSEPSPVLGLTLHVMSAESDPVKSSAIAFRLAGRKAASGLLAALSFSPTMR